MKSSEIACTVIFILFITVNAADASSRHAFLPNSVDFEPPPVFVTVTGCNNDCDTACCHCVIERQPPVCVLCCKEDR
ncbi:hypothetical protein Tsubulata_018671 [Turnera subulata]|uniref:Embryo surrounding factor 1 brassicaceae domain-containing protein n=1 Tax=Turnera subulata TaxID=218843 RepID=A0A9Q0J3H7_9ROSI|nr:hypothetical protein Tsubulata_018671 [Turnera subulata]